MDDGIERRFHTAMLEIYRQAKSELGYVATRFHQMVEDRGGVDAAKQLLHSPPSDGFTTLGDKGRLDLSVEYHVIDPEFSELFTEEERRIAEDRLEQFGFDPTR